MPIQIADKPTLDLVKAKLDLVKAKTDLLGTPNPEAGGTDELFKYMKRLEEILCSTCKQSATVQYTIATNTGGVGGWSETYNIFMPYTGTVYIIVTSKGSNQGTGFIQAVSKNGLHTDTASTTIDNYSASNLNLSPIYIGTYHAVRVVAGGTLRVQLHYSGDFSMDIQSVAIGYTRQPIGPVAI